MLRKLIAVLMLIFWPGVFCSLASPIGFEPTVQHAVFMGQNTILASLAPTPSVFGCALGSGSGVTLACTPYSNTTGNTATIPAGSTLWCAINTFTSGLTYSITDSASDTFTAEYPSFSASIGSTGFFQSFYTLSTASGVTSITLSNTTATSMSFPSIICLSATGVTGQDSAPYTTGPGTNMHKVATGTTISVGPFTTTAADWIPCAGFGTGGNTLSSGSGFSYGTNPSVAPWNTFIGSNAVSEYIIQGAAGAITPTITVSASSATEVLCGALK